MNEQGSVDWKKDRAGKFTASRFCDVLARNKKTKEPLKAYYDLLWDVVTERITNEPIESASSYSMQWGKDVEPFAREAYELHTGNVVVETGFFTHPQYDFIGASPDGLIGVDGGLEMKCPKSPRVHLERFLSGVPEEYVPQIQGCMWVTGRAWWDFMSYDPRMPESHRILIVRVHRDNEFIATLEAEVLKAESLVAEMLNDLTAHAA